MDEFAWGPDAEFAYEADLERASEFGAAFGLQPLSMACQRERGIGATRYIHAASFQPDWIVTCVWRKSGLVVETAFGASGLHDSWRPFDPTKVQRRRRFVSFSLLPWPFHRFEHMKTATEVAPSCSTMCFDGFVACHMLWESGRFSAAGWSNPCPPRHVSQWALVRAYSLLVCLSDFRWSLYHGVLMESWSGVKC